MPCDHRKTSPFKGAVGFAAINAFSARNSCTSIAEGYGLPIKFQLLSAASESFL